MKNTKEFQNAQLELKKREERKKYMPEIYQFHLLCRWKRIFLMANIDFHAKEQGNWNRIQHKFAVSTLQTKRATAAAATNGGNYEI